MAHILEYDHYVEKFKALKNPEFYLYKNQIEYLALNYPIFIKNNYFIKNDIQIKNFEDKINYVYLLNNDKLVYITNKGLIIEGKNYIIPYVHKLCLTNDNNIIIIMNYDINKKLKVIKLNENDYEIIETINNEFK